MITPLIGSTVAGRPAAAGMWEVLAVAKTPSRANPMQTATIKAVFTRNRAYPRPKTWSSIFARSATSCWGTPSRMSDRITAVSAKRVDRG